MRAHSFAPAATMLLALLSNSVAAQGPAGTPDAAAEIRAKERALAGAIHTRNRLQLEQLLAPDYILRGAPDIDRATWLQNALTLCWGDRSDITAFRARRHDDVVVASFELTFYLDPGTCRPAVLRSLITDMWTRQGGDWQLQIRHASSPPPSNAGIAAQYGSVPEPPPAWDVSSDLSLVATGGNTSTRTIGLGARVVHRTHATSTRASIAFLTNEVDTVTRARSLSMQARHGFHVAERVELFGDGSYARDRFAGIDDRTAAAMGAAYTAPLPRPHALVAEGSFGFTLEQRLDGTDLRFATATGAMRYAWTIVPGTELAEDIGLNADLEVAGNWRGTSTTALRVTLSRLLSVKTSHAFEYRNTPVAGFGRVDMRTAAALVFSLQRRPGTR
jgi:putative salt-induced outer membrane protein YdiY